MRDNEKKELTYVISCRGLPIKPRSYGARLPAGMADLHAELGSLAVGEVDNLLQGSNVAIILVDR